MSNLYIHKEFQELRYICYSWNIVVWKCKILKKKRTNYSRDSFQQKVSYTVRSTYIYMFIDNNWNPLNKSNLKFDRYTHVCRLSWQAVHTRPSYSYFSHTPRNHRNPLSIMAPTATINETRLINPSYSISHGAGALNSFIVPCERMFLFKGRRMMENCIVYTYTHRGARNYALADFPLDEIVFRRKRGRVWDISWQETLR